MPSRKQDWSGCKYQYNSMNMAWIWTAIKGLIALSGLRDVQTLEVFTF